MQGCHRIYIGGKKQVQILSLIITISAVRMIILSPYIIVIVCLKHNLTQQNSMLLAPGKVF